MEPDRTNLILVCSSYHKETVRYTCESLYIQCFPRKAEPNARPEIAPLRQAEFVTRRAASRTIRTISPSALTKAASTAICGSGQGLIHPEIVS